MQAARNADDNGLTTNEEVKMTKPKLYRFALVLAVAATAVLGGGWTWDRFPV